jgi:hypothetical protein
MIVAKALLRGFIPAVCARDPKAIMPRQDIVRMLDEHKVPWKESWGIPPARTFEAFCEYHQRDRFYFRNGNSHNGNGNGNGFVDKLIIDVHAAIVIVIHRYRRAWLELYEDRQEFPDGSTLRRANFNGIAETLKRIETIPRGARRCLKEELGFREPVPSEKWPGIWAAYHRNVFECTISRNLFRSDGYVEREGDRTIYFKWRPRRQLQFAI